MPPRRKSKKALDTDAEADNASVRSTPPPSAAFTIGPLLNDVDLNALTGFFPEATLETPSPVLIVQCYKLILNLADQLGERTRDVEELQAEAERKDIELDQALQDKENAIADLEVAMEPVQKELGIVKAEKEELAASRATLESRLSSLNNSQSSSSNEVVSIKKKIEEVEREKRDLLGVVSRLQDDVAQREEEIGTLRESLKTARKDAQELESSVRDIRSSERSTTFKVETLTHQLQLAKDENERTNVELSKKSEEYSNYRRDKHTEVIQLQSELDSVKQTHNQTLSTLRTLQTSHNSQSQQLSQALQKVHDLTSQLADQEAKYSSEASNLRRLVQMMEERENQAKELVAGIERDWEGLGEKAAASEAKLREALEEEQRRSKELEDDLEELRGVLERVNAGELPVPSASYGSPNASSESLFGLSPGIAMINRMQKSGKTFTEVYADYVRMQGELAAKTRDMDNMDRTLAAVLSELEEKAPALARQKIEMERIQAESDQLATQLSRALADRDACMVQVENANKNVNSIKKENDMLNQQIEDVGRQLKALLKELGRLHDATLPSDEDMQDIQPVRDIEEVITNHLVLYRSIPQLQEQNMKLLRCIRELGARMESEERDYKEQLDNEQAEAIREAHEAIQALQTQLESTQSSQQATIQAYTKERDTLKMMLVRYERGGAVPAPMPGVEDSSVPHVNGIIREPSELEKELEEERNNFDAYRKEMGVDSVKLREEVMQYQREASQLGAALAKANARIEHLQERQRMAQDQHIMHERESQDLRKRNQQLQEQYIRLDLASNRASEDMAAANSQIERLRNDCSNLRAEKKIWENVQGRLLDENKILSVERSRMADLIGNVQKMHNDIDRANESDRRRFETQIQTLENQTQDLRTQLSRERDTVRQTSLQKDIEVQELRSKIDRTTENLSKSREALVEAETSRKHLQERVEQLTKQVQMNEERLAVYERRTSSISGTVESSSSMVVDVSNSAEQTQLELAEARGELKVALVDLASARSHVQQFQEISQASEAALQSLSATHDEYTASTEAQIAKHEAQQKSLEERIASMEEELGMLGAKKLEALQTLEKERAAFAQDKKMLEDTIVDITNAEMNSRTDQASRESDVREQMERARVAEEKYSREVVAHAESIKIVDALKKDLNEARATLREKIMQAETAQANIAASEASWTQQREALDKEVSDLNARCKSLTTQNALLHQHLESVSSQASRIRQAADSNISMPESGEADDADGRMAELRSVVAYLRKEKEIVDLQLELSKQESARQKTQIDHLTQALEETRTTLSNEREEAAKSVGNSAEHTELLERITQLNILRESNATLRAESDAYARKSSQLETTLDQLRSELDPVKEEAKMLRAELDARNSQIQRLEDENRQWKERNSQLLTKYDRIDPNDVQALKDEIEDLQIDVRKAEEEKAAYIAEAEAQAKRLEDTQTTLSEFRTKYNSLGQESRTRLGQLNQQIAKLNETVSDLRKQVKDLSAEKDLLAAQTMVVSADSNSELEAVKAQLASANQEKETSARLLAEEMTNSAKASAESESALYVLREERDKLLAEKSSSQSGEPSAPESGDAVQIRQQLEAERVELTKARDEALARAKSAEERIAKALNDARNIRLQNEKFQARIAENEKRRIAEGEKLTALSEKHKQEQDQAVTAATEKLRAELQTPGADTTEITARHAAEIRALEAKLVAKHEGELKAAVEKAREEARVEALKTAGSATQGDQQQISAEEHEQALKAATERGRMESATKIRLKDGMLQKAQANVKHLEAQIKSWREAGIVPANAPTIAPGTVVTPAKATAPVPAKSAPSTNATPAGAASTTASAAGPSTVATPAALPKKPSLNVTAPTAAPDASARGARGGMRGVRGARGVARGGAVRGGAPAVVAQAAASAAEGGMSIMGAAGKRAREETENGTDSLAKRIKPAENAGKPVALRRDRIATSNPTPPS